MRYRTLQRKINIRKFLLNTLLHHLKPTNRFMVYISQDLDKLIVEAQILKYKKQSNIASHNLKSLSSQVA